MHIHIMPKRQTNIIKGWKISHYFVRRWMVNIYTLICMTAWLHKNHCIHQQCHLHCLHYLGQLSKCPVKKQKKHMKIITSTCMPKIIIVYLPDAGKKVDNTQHIIMKTGDRILQWVQLFLAECLSLMTPVKSSHRLSAHFYQFFRKWCRNL